MLTFLSSSISFSSSIGATLRRVPFLLLSLLLVLLTSYGTVVVNADCLANSELNDFFEYNHHRSNDGDGDDAEDDRRQSIPRFGSCCMYDVCGLACPTPNLQPNDGTLLFTYGNLLCVGSVLSLFRDFLNVLVSLFFMLVSLLCLYLLQSICVLFVCLFVDKYEFRLW